MTAERQTPTLTPPMTEILPDWLAGQRWYAGKGRRPQLRRLGGFRLEDPQGQVGLETHIVADLSGPLPVVYQVPLSYRGAPLTGAERCLVATARHSELGPRWIYDATHDPAYVRALLALVLGSGAAGPSRRSEGADEVARGQHTSGPTDVLLDSSSVLTGEQSNTSIICTVHHRTGEPADPIIIKVFRTLQDGDNPDVTVPAALTAAGSTQVPETVGYVAGGWLAPDHVEAERRYEEEIAARIKAAVDARTQVVEQIQHDRQVAAAELAVRRERVARKRERELERRREAVRPTLHDALLADPEMLAEVVPVREDDLPDPAAVPEPVLPERELPPIPGRSDFPAFVPQVAHGHLAFAQRFFPGVQDAWREALVAAERGADFTGPARELGEATARIHVSLAEALGTTPAAGEARAPLLASIRSRYHAALGEVPALVEHEEVILALVDEFGRSEWPALQRVHGDYHLGQVLHVPGRGWVAVDFEGEPLRPLAERVRPDLALRDVAGMLRSFDYAGGSVELATAGASARGWVGACRAAFLGGYAAVTGLDLATAAPVLRVLELDKALYEVVYEARNRPTWLGIPTAAIARLITDSKASS